MQHVGLERNTIDKYYTKDEMVDLCMNQFEAHVSINNNDVFIEPSAGNGAFINRIKQLGECHFYDLEPEHPSISRQDYLLLDTSSFINKTVHVIGNPPFGRQSSLSIQFIKKSCSFASSVSFILPKSFKKESLKKHIPLLFHLVYEMDLPKNSFLVNGVEHNVPCVFQIWIKKQMERMVTDKMDPVGFRFVKKNENPDISFRRVGVNAGTITINTEKSEQSHYFITFTNGRVIEDNLNTLSSITYEKDNTVGPKSISKQELILIWNNLLN
jgi:hypothetical protein